MRPVFWRCRRSSSGPNKPSVLPKTAPITSGFSTTPSISNLAWTTYFIVKVWDVPVNVQLLVSYIYLIMLIALKRGVLAMMRLLFIC
jgi:hypothetical protein